MVEDLLMGKNPSKMADYISLGSKTVKLLNIGMSFKKSRPKTWQTAMECLDFKFHLNDL
jgi:hypothetical protein